MLTSPTAVVARITARPSRTMTLAACMTLLLMAGCAGSGGGRSDTDEGPAAAASPADIRGSTLLCLGDPGGGPGTLTIVSLPIREPVTPSAQVDVRADPLGPPGSLAISPDGRFAFVAQADDAGDTVAIVDLRSAPPRVVQQAFVGQSPRGVAINGSGDLLAVVTRQPGAPLVMLPINGNVPTPAGEALAWPLSRLSNESAAASSVQWHPSGRMLAITLPESDEVAFFAVERGDGDTIEIALAAPPTRVGPTPLHAAFAHDGRVLVCLCASRDAGGSMPISPGQLCAVAVPELPRRWEKKGELLGPSPRVIGRAALPPGPAGIAISPGGREVAAVCTSGADGTPGRGGTLSVLTIDRSGEMSLKAQTSLGAVPAGVAFDASGRFVLVSQFGSLDPEAAAGEVSFWRVGARTLTQQDFFVGIGAGPHGGLIVR